MAETIDVGSHSPANGKERLVSIDAARGSAMFMVCLSHFAIMYWGTGDGASPRISVWLTAVSMIASPTFFLISGMMLGFLYHTRRTEFQTVRASLVDRGLFLLTVGHVLIALAHIPRLPDGGWSRFVFVTDAIAISVIVGPLLVGVLGARSRLFVGASVYVLAWVITLAWSPDAHFPQLLKDAFAGSVGTNTWNYSFPIIPWFGVYLIGSALGEHLGRLYVAGDARRFERLALKLGGAAVLLAVALKLAYWELKPALLAFSGLPLDLIYSLSSPWQKIPPGPVYVLLCGGSGLLMLSLIWWAERTGRFRHPLRLAALWGRTSLFLFVVQYYVYYVGFFYLRPAPSRWWPLFFLASLAVMTGAASEWSRRGYNRYLTLGLRHLLGDATGVRTGRWHRRKIGVAPARAER